MCKFEKWNNTVQFHCGSLASVTSTKTFSGLHHHSSSEMVVFSYSSGLCPNIEKVSSSYIKVQRCLFTNGLNWCSKKIVLNVYSFLRDRERQSVSRGGAARGGDTESEAGCRLWTVSTEPHVGLKLKDHEIMTWADVGSSSNWATQRPPH